MQNRLSYYVNSVMVSVETEQLKMAWNVLSAVQLNFSGNTMAMGLSKWKNFLSFFNVYIRVWQHAVKLSNTVIKVCLIFGPYKSTNQYEIQTLKMAEATHGTDRPTIQIYSSICEWKHIKHH